MNKTVSVKTTPKPYTLDHLGDLISSAFKLFPQVWWRVGLMSVISNFLVFVSLFILGGVALLLGGGWGAWSSVYANLMIGTPPALPFILLGVSTIILCFIALFVLLIWSTIAQVLVCKEVVAGKKRSHPMTLFFKVAPDYFWRYVGLSFWVVFYCSWILILAGVVIHLNQISDFFGLPFALFFVSAVLFILGFLVLIYRSIRSLFAFSVLIHKGGTMKEAFETSLNMTYKSVFKVFVTSFAFGCIIFGLLLLVGIVFGLSFVGLSQVVGGAEVLEASIVYNVVIEILDFIFQNFIISPLVIGFVYLFMLDVAKVRKIKL